MILSIRRSRQSNKGNCFFLPANGSDFSQCSRMINSRNAGNREGAKNDASKCNIEANNVNLTS